MIVASDLDRTIIHPVGEIARAGDPAPEVRVVEIYNGEPVTCMSERSIALLGELARRHTFVPVTTRTRTQYERITAIAELEPEWAIVANGAELLHHGEPDREWSALHAERLRGALPLAEVVERIAALGRRGPDGWILRQKLADEHFAYAIVDRELVPFDELVTFTAELAEGGWDVHLHGRKLYVIPTVTSKLAAVRHLAERLGDDVIAVAGDSELDRCLADGASHAYCPAGSELASAGPLPHGMRLTTAEHVRATEEILGALLAAA